jgi:tetratricopeptide (TPR) repeat protein
MLKMNGAKKDAALASLLFVSCFALYLGTLAPTVVFGASGGFALAAAGAGVAHPPGFPLYAQLGTLFQLLPVGDAAFKLNAMSALFGGAGIAALFWAARGFGASRFASTLGAAACALAPALWSRSLVADRHALDFLLVALFLAAMSGAGRKAVRAVPAAAVVAALAALNGWLFAAALMPVVAVAALSGGRLRRRLSALAVSAFAVVSAAALPVFIPLRAASSPFVNWGSPGTHELFLDYMRSARLIDPANRLAFDASGFAGRLADFAHGFQFEFISAHILLGLIGFALALSEKPRRAAALAWISATLTAGAIFFFSFSGDESTAGELKAQHIGAFAVFALFIAVGADGIVRRISATRARALAPVAAVILLATIASPLSANLRAVDMKKETRAESLALDFIKRLPRDATHFAQGSQFALPEAYVARSRNLRADIETIDATGGYFAERLAGPSGGTEAALDQVAGDDRLRRPQAFDARRLMDGAAVPMKQRGPFFFISDASGCDPDGWDPAASGFTPETTAGSDYDTRAAGPMLKLRAAECKFAQGSTGAGFNLVQEASDEFPESARIRTLAAAELEQRGFKNEALEKYHQAVSMCGSCAETITRIGGLMAAGGELHSASVYYKRALDKRPGFVEAELGLANIARLNGELAQADEIYSRLLEKRPDSIVILNNYANLKAQTRRIDEAEKMFRAALKIDPRSAFTALNFSSFLLETGRVAEAARILETALDRNPHNAPALYNAGVAAHRSGNIESAERFYNAAVSTDPDLINAWTNLILLQLDSGRLSQARETSKRMNLSVSKELGEQAFIIHLKTERRALESDPMDETAWASLVGGLIILGQREQAEAALKEMRAISGGRLSKLDARLQQMFEDSKAR